MRPAAAICRGGAHRGTAGLEEIGAVELADAVIVSPVQARMVWVRASWWMKRKRQVEPQPVRLYRSSEIRMFCLPCGPVLLSGILGKISQIWK
jgi:hypothetical protein